MEVASVLVALACLVGGVLGLLFTPSAELLTSESEPSPEMASVSEDESGFWPYLNTRRSFQKDSPINVVVRANASRVLDVMENESDAGWTPPPSDQQIGFGEWGWSDHYAYVQDGTDGVWIDMTAELEDGDYYGERYHVRLYEAPTGERVLLQAHTEYFDWFTLRHTVTGTERGQRYVETDFAGHSAVEDVRHLHLGNGDTWDSDGRATVVELALVLPVLLLGRVSFRRWTDSLAVTARRRLQESRRRVSWPHALLAGTIVGLLLGVRVAGIALERHAGFRSMTTIAALLFPVTSIGIPAATYGIARRMEPHVSTAVTAALGLSIAILLDLLYVGGDVLPLAIVVQRSGLVVAVGLVAGGAARRSRFDGLLTGGVVLWGGLVAVGLLNLI